MKNRVSIAEQLLGPDDFKSFCDRLMGTATLYDAAGVPVCVNTLTNADQIFIFKVLCTPPPARGRPPVPGVIKDKKAIAVAQTYFDYIEKGWDREPALEETAYEHGCGVRTVEEYVARANRAASRVHVAGVDPDPEE
jgi:hypothetical protein